MILNENSVYWHDKTTKEFQSFCVVNLLYIHKTLVLPNTQFEFPIPNVCTRNPENYFLVHTMLHFWVCLCCLQSITNSNINLPNICRIHNMWLLQHNNRFSVRSRKWGDIIDLNLKVPDGFKYSLTRSTD